ncbi:MAG: rRNA maturation RNase YbeY [Bacteroidota bacterium]|nr:rRNA maturation RNase YbeY [Bacteroidota bacterium]
MSINFYSEDVDMPDFNKPAAAAWIRRTIKSENREAGDCSIIFCSDIYLLEINKKYLNHNYFTDIVAFDYGENNTVSGDLFISVDRVKDNAAYYDVDINHELHRVMIHGILHLCGYNDSNESEQKQMREKENYYLEMGGLL